MEKLLKETDNFLKNFPKNTLSEKNLNKLCNDLKFMPSILTKEIIIKHAYKK